MKIHRFTLLATLTSSAAFSQIYTDPSSGNVGIGTTNPSAKLHVQGGDIALSWNTGILIPGYNRTELLRVAYDNVNGWEDFVKFNVPGNSGSAGVEMRMASGGGGKFTFSGGNVGIGTTTPISLLNVVANNHNADHWLGVFSPGIDANGYRKELIFGYHGTEDYAYIQGHHVNTRWSHLVLQRYGGYVGIGTTNPSAALTVTNGDDARLKLYSNGGSIAVIDAVANTNDSVGRWLSINPSGANVGIGTVTPDKKLTIVSEPSANNSMIRLGCGWNAVGQDALIGIGDAPGGTINYVQFGGVVDAGASMAFTVRTKNSAGTGNPEERMRITGSGNVGIGTTNPAHKLAVNGTIKAKEVIVETAGWSDYVFADDYRLAPLAEVEAHIKINKHLPGIPSAAQVAEKGVNLGDVQSALLAKVEELTLHLIAQQKQLATQQQNLAALQKENQQLQHRLHAIEQR